MILTKHVFQLKTVLPEVEWKGPPLHKLGKPFVCVGVCVNTCTYLIMDTGASDDDKAYATLVFANLCQGLKDRLSVKKIGLDLSISMCQAS